ncbi:hypothetical protein ACFQ14_04330 [Pseudahrensia aquimaris]|uniref:DUF945 domain-containing protein n=1 Tax=Pseudahrensia aquimaris TaxID=744461 RepID=A0ABW3FAY8_9HYPH
MTMPRFSTKALALSLALSVSGLSSQAFAFDATNLLERYTALAETQGQKFAYESVDASSDGFTVKGATWTFEGMAPIKSETLTFDGVSEASDGSVKIDTITVDSIVSGENEVVVTFDKAVMEGLRIPKEGETRSLEQMAFYNSFLATGGQVTNQGNVVAKLGDMSITLSDFSPTAPLTFAMTLADSMIDVSMAPDPQFKQTLEALGYGTNFTVSTNMQGVWNTETGIIDVSKHDYSIADVGTISMPMKIGGYSSENVLAMQKSVGAGGSDEAAMQQLSNVTIHNLAISFKDDSVTKRALEMASKQMQQPPEQLAAGAPLMIGMGMAQLQMPEFTQMVQAAVGKFLQNPGTLSVTAAPEKPTPVMELVGGAANPKGLVDMLNVKVTAE